MTNHKKTIDNLVHDVVATFERYQLTGTNTWNFSTAVLDLQYQLGSLTKCIMQLKGDRFADGKSHQALRESIGDELADILAGVLFVAHELGIDLDDAWEKMLASDDRKISARAVGDDLRHRRRA